MQIRNQISSLPKPSLLRLLPWRKATDWACLSLTAGALLLPASAAPSPSSRRRSSSSLACSLTQLGHMSNYPQPFETRNIFQTIIGRHVKNEKLRSPFFGVQKSVGIEHSMWGNRYQSRLDTGQTLPRRKMLEPNFRSNDFGGKAQNLNKILSFTSHFLFQCHPCLQQENCRQ